MDSVDSKSDVLITPTKIEVNGTTIFEYQQQYVLEDFPNWYEQNTDVREYRFMVQPKLIASCSTFAGKDQLRPILSCVCYDQENYAATDAHTMVFEKTTPTSNKFMPNALFDRKLISLLPKTETMWINYEIFKSTTTEQTIPYDNSRFVFDNG
jgi:hypothetical protein